jgi:hypothetical protein
VFYVSYPYATSNEAEAALITIQGQARELKARLPGKSLFDSAVYAVRWVTDPQSAFGDL